MPLQMQFGRGTRWTDGRTDADGGDVNNFARLRVKLVPFFSARLRTAKIEEVERNFDTFPANNIVLASPLNEEQDGRRKEGDELK